jgi:hypothetical protein
VEDDALGKVVEMGSSPSSAEMVRWPREVTSMTFFTGWLPAAVVGGRGLFL